MDAVGDAVRMQLSAKYTRGRFGPQRVSGEALYHPGILDRTKLDLAEGLNRVVAGSGPG